MAHPLDCSRHPEKSNSNWKPFRKTLKFCPITTVGGKLTIIKAAGTGKGEESAKVQFHIIGL